jgi:4-aminobutyrate aminotransferase-like enzyme
VVKLDLSRSFNEVIPSPAAKRSLKEEVIVEEDSKFFEKYINQERSKQAEVAGFFKNLLLGEGGGSRPAAEATDFFKNLLQGGGGGSRPAAARTQ